MLRKLSTKTACSRTPQEIAKAGREKKTPLYDIMGICNGTKTVSTDYGESTGLLGNFESRDIETGEIKSAPVYWPPTFVAEMLNAKLLSGKDDPAFSVQFALRVGVHPDESSGLGWSYYVDTLSDTDISDPFKTLRDSLPALEDKSKGKAKKPD